MGNYPVGLKKGNRGAALEGGWEDWHKIEEDSVEQPSTTRQTKRAKAQPFPESAAPASPAASNSPVSTRVPFLYTCPFMQEPRLQLVSYSAARTAD